MIKVSIKKDNITIKGHANFSSFGTDIVCASVSSIVTTTVNGILSIDNDSLTYESKEGYLNISIKKHTKTTDVLVKNMINLLKELASDYKKNIEIQEEV